LFLFFVITGQMQREQQNQVCLKSTQKTTNFLNKYMVYYIFFIKHFFFLTNITKAYEKNVTSLISNSLDGLGDDGK